ncbi:tetratricopeptide repeat protein [Streptomyces anulatus]
MPGTTRDSRVADARKIVALIYSHYLKDLDPSAAVELATNWQLTAISMEGEKSREATRESTDKVLARLNESQAFEQNLSTFNDWRRREATELRASWPSVERIVSALHDAAFERGEILASWSTTPPSWLQGAPWTGYAFLASLASDYGQHAASSRFSINCLEEGGHPRGYWVARAAMQMQSYDEVGAENLCENSDASHPLLEAQLAIFRECHDDAIENLEAWVTQNPYDTAIKVRLLALAWNAKGDLSKAVGLLEEAHASAGGGGVALMAAQLLLVRATGRNTGTRLNDAQKALSLSLQARNARRQWHGDSVSPLVTAVQAAIISGNTEKAWELTQPIPAGDATVSEANDPEVLSLTSQVAALTGRFEAAEKLINGKDPNSFQVAHIRALIAEAKSDGIATNSEVERLWQRAWSLAETDENRLMAAMGIAEAGGILPDLTFLDSKNSEAVQEIRDISRALGGPREATVSLRANVHKSRILAVKLAQRIYSQGDVAGAAEVLLTSSVRWMDPQLAAMAAGRFREAGMPEKAREAARSALSKGGAAWAGAGWMHALLIEVESASGNVDAALAAARSLLSLDENDEDARWAIVRCLMLKSEMEPAWHAMQHKGGPSSPRNQTEAIIWINLNARFSVDPKLPGKALKLMKEWPDDERLLGVFIGVLLTRLQPRGVPVSEADSALLRSAIDDFLSRFPDSQVFSAVKIADDADPLATLADPLRDSHERLREVMRMASAGAIPVGLVGEVAGRSYTEASLLQASGLVYADFDSGKLRGESVLEDLPGKVVLDVTAAHTLTLLDQETSEDLIGRVVDLTTTDSLYRDSMRAHEELSLQSEMTLLWDEEASAPSVHLRSAEESQQLIQKALHIREIMGGARRVPWAELRNFSELAKHSTADWLTGLDYAMSEGAAFWSDDRVLRSVGREKGVTCFSTLDFVRLLLKQGHTGRDEATAIEAVLIRNNYVDIPFSEEAFKLAASSDGWRAQGAASSLTRPTFWRNPGEVMAAVFHAIGRVWVEDPIEVTGWIASAGVGLVRAGGNSEQSNHNLAVFLRSAIGQSWLQASTLPYVLNGLRSALKEKPGLVDPTHKVLGEIYGVLVERVGYETAASYLIGLFSNAQAEDKAIASRVILLHK